MLPHQTLPATLTVFEIKLSPLARKSMTDIVGLCSAGVVEGSVLGDLGEASSGGEV